MRLAAATDLDKGVMTRDGGFLTDSQEQAIRELCPDIDMENLPISLSGLDNIPLDYNSQEYANCNYIEEPNIIVEDNKVALQSTIASVDSNSTYYFHQPVLQTPILGKEEFAGPYNFQLILKPQNNGKHWIYSEKLAKVFIHMEEVLPLQFQWTPPVDGLWVRATLVYKLDQYRSQPVVRCHNHMAPDNSSNSQIDTHIARHVVRCLHTISTYSEAPNGHLSVVTPLGTPEAGVNNVPMDFKFYCKNSCASGMNRRSTELIFTLENAQNEIVGRRKLEVRVCSCPKRDKEKEEAEVKASSSSVPVGKKRKIVQLPSGVPPPGKKLAVDNKVYTVNLEIVGRENANAVMKYAYDLMAGCAARSNNTEVYRPYMEEISKKMP